MREDRDPTMKDVAREAGVSLGTVSKVINGIPVGRAYQKKVEAAVEKLHYRVNHYAKGLKSQRTSTIAVIVPDLENRFFAKLTNHICLELAKRSYRMMISATAADEETEQLHLDLAAQNKVDGIILLSYNEHTTVPEGVPVVSIDRQLGKGHPCVTSDNFYGGKCAVERLLEGGCQRLCFLGIGSQLPNEATKRGDGFLCACTDRGVPFERFVLTSGTPFARFEEFLAQHTVDGKLEFDGIVCDTDLLAAHIRIHLNKIGIRVPEDVQIIGFDGIRRFGTNEYEVSTIVQDVERMAETCVELVLAKEQEHKMPLVCLPVWFAEGGTTAVE